MGGQAPPASPYGFMIGQCVPAVKRTLIISMGTDSGIAAEAASVMMSQRGALPFRKKRVSPLRLRRRKNLDSRLAAVSEWFLREKTPGRNLALCAPEAVGIAAELGCGMGGFIEAKARIQPQVFHLAFERDANALVRAAERAATAELHNVRFILDDAQALRQYVADGELSLLYINFCNPWPARRHLTRRLTHPRFLEDYAALLRPNGVMAFKTDNRDLFAYSLDALRRENWHLLNVTEDLHGTGPRPTDDVITEYERKFMALGIRIFRLEARPPS